MGLGILLIVLVMAAMAVTIFHAEMDPTQH